MRKWLTAFETAYRMRGRDRAFTGSSVSRIVRMEGSNPGGKDEPVRASRMSYERLRNEARVGSARAVGRGRLKQEKESQIRMLSFLSDSQGAWSNLVGQSESMETVRCAVNTSSASH